MIAWLQKLLGSSLGKKLVMALTGLLLLGFLLAHLAGNLLLYADQDGKAFDGYEHALSSNALLPLAELGLGALFLVHIVQALRVSAENRGARKSGYALDPGHGGRTLGSSTMLITGGVVLVFLVLHLIDFRVGKLSQEEYSMAGMVRSKLGTPLGAGVYLLGMVALGIHLSHGFQSALQTLGVSHPRYTPLARRLCVALAILIALGFASFPIFFLAGGGAR